MQGPVLALLGMTAEHMFSLNIGHLIVAFTALFFLVASYAVLLSAFLPSTGIYVCRFFRQRPYIFFDV